MATQLMRLRRVSDSWEFTKEMGDWVEYTPPIPRIKTNEISTIRGVSRYQGLGHAGSLIKFKLRFNEAKDAYDFMTKYDAEYQFMCELGKTYRGVFKDNPDLKTISEGDTRIYELMLTFYSIDIAGVGYVANN